MHRETPRPDGDERARKMEIRTRWNVLRSRGKTGVLEINLLLCVVWNSSRVVHVTISSYFRAQNTLATFSQKNLRHPVWTNETKLFNLFMRRLFYRAAYAVHSARSEVVIFSSKGRSKGRFFSIDLVRCSTALRENLFCNQTTIQSYRTNVCI